MEDEQLVILDQFYALKLEKEGEGGVRGEIIRLSADPKLPATHLFDTPVQADVSVLREWSLRALQAYREG